MKFQISKRLLSCAKKKCVQDVSLLSQVLQSIVVPSAQGILVTCKGSRFLQCKKYELLLCLLYKKKKKAKNKESNIVATLMLLHNCNGHSSIHSSE